MEITLIPSTLNSTMERKATQETCFQGMDLLPCEIIPQTDTNQWSATTFPSSLCSENLQRVSNGSLNYHDPFLGERILEQQENSNAQSCVIMETYGCPNTSIDTTTNDLLRHSPISMNSDYDTVITASKQFCPSGVIDDQESWPRYWPAMPKLDSLSVEGDGTTLRCWDHGCNGRTFSTSGNLRRHLKEQRDRSKNWVCYYCGRGFSRSTACRSHIKRATCQKASSHKSPKRTIRILC